MRVLICPGRIGPVCAVDAARGLAAAWAQAGHETIHRPMSDGCAELVDVVRRVRGGELVPVIVPAGAAGSGGDVPAALLHVPGRAGGTAYVETGAVLGRDLPGVGGAVGAERLLREASTEVVADLLVAAMETGATRIVMGLGESVVHDAGIGVLRRLGVLLEVPGGLATVDALRERLARLQIEVAASTDLPLLGLNGAGAALARIPGVGPELAQEAERRAGEVVDQVLNAQSGTGADRAGPSLLAGAPRPEVRPTRDPGTGAGGGAAFALAALGARILPGAEVAAAEIGLPELAAEVDLVVTGSTRLDGAAMHSGVVAASGRAAMAAGVPVVAVGEEVQVSRRDGARVGVSATYPVRDSPMPGTGRQVPPPGDPWEALVRRGQRIRRTWAP